MTSRKKESIDWKLLIWAIVLCQLAGVIGTIFTMEAIPTWYADLVKPSFNPPNWVFGPVWTILYTLMGVSLYGIWKANPSLGKGFAEKLFYTQLILNSAWSIIFFGIKSPLLALFEIAVLWVIILLTILAANRISSYAGKVLIPYILWVSFATLLNASIVLLN